MSAERIAKVETFEYEDGLVDQQAKLDEIKKVLRLERNTLVYLIHIKEQEVRRLKKEYDESVTELRRAKRGYDEVIRESGEIQKTHQARIDRERDKINERISELDGKILSLEKMNRKMKKSQKPKRANSKRRIFLEDVDDYGADCSVGALKYEKDRLVRYLKSGEWTGEEVLSMNQRVAEAKGRFAEAKRSRTRIRKALDLELEELDRLRNRSCHIAEIDARKVDLVDSNSEKAGRIRGVLKKLKMSERYAMNHRILVDEPNNQIGIYFGSKNTIGQGCVICTNDGGYVLYSRDSFEI